VTDITNTQLELILNALKGLEYGSIHITVHDSQITQIDRLEKIRFPVQKRNSEEKNN
jgi:hypothetical protein